MTDPATNVDSLVPAMLDLITGNLHLYAVSVVYWLLVAAFFASRYLLGRVAASDRLRVPIVGVGVLAVAVAVVDVVVRGDAGVTHLSLVAYLATPLGIGRQVVARLDRRPPGTLAALGLRATSYAVAFVAFVVLSALDGDPWFFDRPTIDRSSPEALLAETAWMPFMATVSGALLVLDTVSSLLSAAWERVVGPTRGTDQRRPVEVLRRVGASPARGSLAGRGREVVSRTPGQVHDDGRPTHARAGDGATDRHDQAAPPSAP